MKHNQKPDQNFDSIAKKFENNIYGSSKGKLRHDLLLHYLLENIPIKGKPLKILDAGGGTGVMTLSLLNYGHTLTLNDVSGDSLTIAKDKIGEHERIRYENVELQQLSDHEKFDVVLCHAVLEWMTSPLVCISKLIELTEPNGYLSLSFFNKDAHRFGNLLYGNFDYVKSDMQNKNTVRLNPNNALVPKDILTYFTGLPVRIIHQAGIRCIHDYLKDPQMQTTHFEDLKEMELTYGRKEPYMWLGKYFHIILKRDA